MALGTKLPFCLDVSLATFEKIDLLLREVCEFLGERGGAYPTPLNQDHECMAVAILNLLRLQLYAAISDGTPAEEIGLTPGSPLLSSLKQCVVELARNGRVFESVQSAAQEVLKTGWDLLLPTVSERAAMLSSLLPSGEGESNPASTIIMLHCIVLNVVYSVHIIYVYACNTCR